MLLQPRRRGADSLVWVGKAPAGGQGHPKVHRATLGGGGAITVDLKIPFSGLFLSGFSMMSLITLWGLVGAGGVRRWREDRARGGWECVAGSFDPGAARRGPASAHPGSPAEDRVRQCVQSGQPCSLESTRQPRPTTFQRHMLCARHRPGQRGNRRKARTQWGHRRNTTGSRVWRRHGLARPMGGQGGPHRWASYSLPQERRGEGESPRPASGGWHVSLVPARPGHFQALASGLCFSCL